MITDRNDGKETKEGAQPTCVAPSWIYIINCFFMETIRFRLQTYGIKLETGWSKLVQIGFSTKNVAVLVIASNRSPIRSTPVHWVHRTIIFLQNTFNIFLQSRERNLTLGFSKSEKASSSIRFLAFLRLKTALWPCHLGVMTRSERWDDKIKAPFWPKIL